MYFQISNDAANCRIYSILASISNVPNDYSALYLRRAMVIEFCNNWRKYNVSIFKIHLKTVKLYAWILKVCNYLW